MKRFVITRTTPANPFAIAALLGGIGLFLAIAAGQMVHAQTDPAGVDNSAYGELVGERYKNEEAPKGKEKSGAHQNITQRKRPALAYTPPSHPRST